MTYPKVGEQFTIGANKKNGDRSWTDKIWTCVCENDNHVVFAHPEWGFTLLLKSEHNFSLMNCPDKVKEEKWSPKRGTAVVGGYGKICKDTSNMQYVKYGVSCPTIELAEALREMTHRNNRIFQAKHEKKFGDGEWAICYSKETALWEAYFGLCTDNPELAFETREQAEIIVEMLELNGV